MPDFSCLQVDAFYNPLPQLLKTNLKWLRFFSYCCEMEGIFNIASCNIQEPFPNILYPSVFSYLYLFGLFSFCQLSRHFQNHCVFFFFMLHNNQERPNLYDLLSCFTKNQQVTANCERILVFVTCFKTEKAKYIIESSTLLRSLQVAFFKLHVYNCLRVHTVIWLEAMLGRLLRQSQQ